MAYELHIVRLPANGEGEATPIPLDDWKAAICTTAGVRLCSPGAHTITNPNTKEEISLPIREGDAEVYFSDDQKWLAVFRWFEGKASFNAKNVVPAWSDPVWSTAVALASHLGAQIRGDEGETYDLETGQMTDESQA